MKKKFTLLQLCSLVDANGRLFTQIQDVYTMLNHIFDEDFETIELYYALRYLEEKNPKWFQEVKQRLETIKARCNSNTFETIVGYIKDKANDTYDIPQLKDEFDISDFKI